MNTTAPRRIVLAYSGGLNTTIGIRWLLEQHQAEIVTVTLDIGQGDELTDIRERALAAGAVRAHVIDAREEFVRDYVLPALQAGALRTERAPLAAALGRALIGKRLVDIARMEGAAAVVHGEVPLGAVLQAGRIDAAVRALDPGLPVIAPAWISEMSWTDKVEYARASGISVSSPQNPYRTDVNLWGRSVISTAAAGGDADGLYTLTRAPADCPDEPAYLDIEFEAGIPVRANGIEMPMAEMIESLEIIAGAHGVGRIGAGDAPAEAAVAVHEAPAAVVLHAAHAALETQVLAPDVQRLKGDLAREYADLVDKGLWHSDAREAMDGFVRATERRVNGTVRLTLLKGECRHDVRPDVSGAGERFDRVAAEGFIS